MDRIRKFGMATTILALCSTVYGDEIRDRIQEKISSVDDSMVVTTINPSPIPGILEVQINNSDYVYSSDDGNYIFTGNFIHITDSGYINLKEERLESLRSDILKDINLSKSITYSSDSEVNEVYVFTDVSCAYCQNFHSHIDEINAAGITVHYFAFPRSGPSSQNGSLMRNVWCSEDPSTALTEAKSTGKMSQRVLPCANPVPEQYALGIKIGVKGTPAIYDSEGRNLGGYLTTEQLVEALD